MKLTQSTNNVNLSLHCNSGVGIRTPHFETGAKTPLLLVVFSFLLAVFVTGLFRAKFVMTGQFVRGLLQPTIPVRGSSNLINSPATQRLEPVGGVFSETGNL